MVDVCDIIKILLQYQRINNDNNIFRLHYKFTVILLLVFSFLVTSKQYFGDPIDCDTGEQNKYIMDTYCWIYSTFTIKRHLHGVIGKTHVQPGVGPAKPFVSNNSDEIISHKYYQWVCIVLFMQAIFFYIPRYLWKIWEAKRLESLVKDFDSPIQSSWTPSYKEYLIKYLLRNSIIHNVYLIRYTFCEILNFINVITQIFIMDFFLNGQFTGFGIALAAFSMTKNEHETSPTSHVFPKLAKCTYPNFGPSGTIQNYDALCVLPVNVINEKIYIILWFWFYILTMLSLLVIIYRISTLSKTIRSYLLRAQVRHLNKYSADNIVNNISFGDWFVLRQIGKNVNSVIFADLVAGLSQAIASPKNKSFV